MLGLRRHTVRVVAHQPAWTERFRDVRLQIADATGIPEARIQHVGSTAVPDLQAKPIIDIDVGIQPSEALESVATQLVRIGFIDRGQKDDGIGRLLVWETAPDVRTIHVHVVEFESDGWHQDLAFRDGLRSSPELRQRYAALKTELADRHPTDRVAYRHGKKSFIRAALKSLATGLVNFVIRPLESREVTIYTALRAQALQADPDAFGETLEVFDARSDDELRQWFEGYVGSPTQGILVAETTGIPSAMCGFGIRESDAREGYLWGVFVSPHIRRRGVAKQLVIAANRTLAALGATRVRAKVAAPNDAAIRFYDNTGFTVGGQVGYLRDGSSVPVFQIELAIQPDPPS